MEGKGTFTYKSGATTTAKGGQQVPRPDTYTWWTGPSTWVWSTTRYRQGTHMVKDGREWVGEFYNNDGLGLKLTI